ncbi:hypothetical protein Dimus_037326 [Dionaea muscipula]
MFGTKRCVCVSLNGRRELYKIINYHSGRRSLSRNRTCAILEMSLAITACKELRTFKAQMSHSEAKQRKALSLQQISALRDFTNLNSFCPTDNLHQYLLPESFQHHLHHHQ